MFCFTYLSYGEIFYVHYSEGNYCAKVFNRWILGDSIEAVTKHIDNYCYHLISLSEEDQG